jgi:hypothetical protein
MRIIFSLFLVAIGFYLVLGHTTRHIAVRRLLFAIFSLTGLLSIIFKDFWTSISLNLGVGSGTELLTYLVSISFISYVITSYRGRRHLEDQIVQLARKVALMEFQNNQSDKRIDN